MNTQISQPIHALRLFGTPSILREGLTPIGGRAAQHHRLALLAMLASADRGWSRDRLMTMLWPESSQVQARNLLKVSVYVLRRALGDDLLTTSGDELSLNPSRITSDVREFRSAVQHHDFEHAVTLSEHPFLDGFHVSRSPEFEHWSDGERQRLAAMRASALETLAETAQRGGDVTASLEWWKARSADDPLDSRVACRYMETLAAAGNLAGALQHATAHERLLRDEVGMDLPLQVRSLAAQLRMQVKVGSDHKPHDTAIIGLAGEPSPMAGAVDGAPAHYPPVPGPPQPAVTADEGVPSVPVGLVGRRATTRRALRWFGLAALPLTALLLTWNMMGRSGVVPPRIAVLPFRNLTGDVSLDARADIIAEQLVSLLGREPRLLRTIASTSSFLFRDRRLDVRRIADSLGASYIVDGSVQKVGPHLQLVLSLVDGRTGIVRWTHVSEENGRGLPTDHAQVANLIADVLGVRLPDARRATSLPGGSALMPVSERRLAAAELYVRSRQQVLYRTTDGRREALALLTSAIGVDSMFPNAYADLAALLTIFESYTGGTRRKQLAIAETAARRALRIDSTLAEARYGLGRVLAADYRLEQARHQFQQALRLDPTLSIVREYLAQLYIFLEQPGDALDEATRAVQDDPLSPNAIAELARALQVNGRCTEALSVLARLRHLQPPPARASNVAALCHLQLGAPRRAIDAQRPMAVRNPTQALGWLGFILARAGEEAEAIEIRDALVAARPVEARAFEVALVNAGLGDFDAAFTWLDRAFDERSLRFDIMSPVLEELHRDPRFEQLRGRLRRR